MKKFFLVFSIFVALNVLAQVPQGINYQAVIRNSNGTTVNNTTVGLRMRIIQGSAAGTPVYAESFTETTTNIGLVNVVLGQGAVIAGSFSTIDWGAGPYFLEIASDPTGGTNYTVMGTQQMMSVPFALYAENSGTPGPQGATGPQGPQGEQGPIGLTGPQGEQGPIGLTGPQGPAGQAGPQGPQGPAGANGVGIISTINNGNGTYTFNYSDGTSYTTGNLTGPQGPIGLTGLQGPSGEAGPQGPQGPTGTNGSNGLNALIKTTAEPAGANCTNGGSKIETGLDANGNGVLDVGEVNVLHTSYVCNGNGSSEAVISGSSIINYDTVPSCLQFIGNGSEGNFNCSGYSGSLSGEHFYNKFTISAGCTLNVLPASTVIIHVRDTCVINGVINGNGALVNPYTETRDWLGAAAGCSETSICGCQTCGYGTFSWTYSPEALNTFLGYGHSKSITKWSGNPMTLNDIRVASNLCTKIHGYSSNYAQCGSSASGKTAQGGAGIIIICKHLIFNGHITVNGSIGGQGAGGGGGGSIIISADNIISNTGTTVTSGGPGASCMAFPGGNGIFYMINY
jgi:hypothetical protein